MFVLRVFWTVMGACNGSLRSCGQTEPLSENLIAALERAAQVEWVKPFPKVKGQFPKIFADKAASKRVFFFAHMTQ
eukprot:3533117-Amphidinium_carterae.1